MRYWLTLLLFIPSLLAQAQFTDDFSDGDFITNPTWSGDAAKFEVNAGNQLHLNAPAVSDVAYLSTASGAINNAVWEFYVQMDFNPSSSNLTKVYLVSDQSNLNNPLNGYYVLLGGTNDEVSLYRQTGSNDSLLIDGTDDRLNVSQQTVTVRVTRDGVGNWELLNDTAGGTNYFSEGTSLEATHIQSSFFGVFCKYTSTRSDKFFFDDFNITGQVFTDTVKPIVQSLTVLSNTTLDIKFSEPVEQTTAETLTNYTVNNGIGNPATATRDGTDLSLVHLTFATPFPLGQLNTMTIANVQDLNSNVIVTVDEDFVYFVTSIGDVLINEIFADPSPSFGLPAQEFVELVNTTNAAIDLGTWTFSDPTTTGTLPSFTLQPDSFVILTSAAGDSAYSTYGATLALSSFPSLNNGGDSLWLRDGNGMLIDLVAYTSDWYKDNDKADGGFTLELIDVNSPCSGMFNWAASNNPFGGTPGSMNSIAGAVSDTSGPVIIAVTITANNQITVEFDEAVDSALAADVNNYSIDNGMGKPVNASPVGPAPTQVVLNLPSTISNGVIYTLTVSNLDDCAGNVISNGTAQFAIPGIPERYDVVINEIFPDPAPQVGLPEAEFVELYNRSNKAFDLKDWEFSNTALNSHLLLPGEYVILCDDGVAAEFEAFGKVLALSSFPSLTNSGELLTLVSNNGSLIHSVDYSSTWYNNPLKEDGGWTLEMIDPDYPCTGENNWAASTNSKGGTPGKINAIDADNPDNDGPVLVRACLVDSITIELIFDEALDSTTSTTPGNFTIDQGIGNPAVVILQEPGLSTVHLRLSTPISIGVIYTITVNGIADCVGNIVLDASEARVGIPDSAVALDVVLNEVLFNPYTGGSDFVELYNRSAKVIDLFDLRMANRDEETDSLDNVEVIANSCYLLFPSEYVALSEDVENLNANYTIQNPGVLLEINDLPSYNDDEGVVVLVNQLGHVLDQFRYTDDMHFELLDDDNGVSLERLDPEKPTQDENNWHSAATTAGSATPGYQNSQYNDSQPGEDLISLDPEVISPDGDGYQDLLNIHYNVSESGWVANIHVYDANGRLINRLVQNELLGLSGTFTWDGVNEEGEKARIGIHILYVEFFDLNGDVQKEKKTFVVGGRL